MKTIGLIGGMSWESSLVYYEIINKKIREILGGYHSCKSVMISVDFAEVETLQHKNDWEALNKIMADAAGKLQAAGADLIVLCTNTMHLCSDAIKSATDIPFLHIAEATGEAIIKKNFKKVALLGTRFTMEKDFYKTVLRDNYSIEVIVPPTEDRKKIHNIIYNELVHGRIREKSRRVYQNIIKDLEKAGAEGVILGCTEIPLLISNDDVDFPVFDTIRIHAEKAVELALKD
jgi:aspartate racemase